jgi:polysaccharide biosynthesis transport protein
MALRETIDPLKTGAFPPGLMQPDIHDDRLTAAELGRLVYRNRWILFVCVLLGLILAVIYTTTRQRRYESTAIIEISPENNPGIAISDSVSSALSEESSERLETQMNILQNDALALAVMRKLRMYSYADVPAKDLTDTSPVSTPSSYGDDGLTPDQREGCLYLFHRDLKVKLRPNTELVEVHYRSPDPRLAAKVANTLVSMYIEETFESRYDAANQISQWITQQLNDVKATAAADQLQLAALQKRSGIIGTSESDNTITDKLRQVNEELTNAEADRIVKEAQYRMVQARDPNTIAASLQDPTLQVLRSHQAQLKLEFAQLDAKFGQGYPPLRELTSELQENNQAINTEIDRVTQKIKGDYQTALQTEQMLQQEYDNQKQQAYALNADAAQYAILQREVLSNRDLYENLQLKLKQAGISAGLSSSNTTVVDYARPGTHPVDPKVPLDIAIGLTGGLFFGIAIAFIRSSLDTTVRDLEETEMITGLPAIAFIPRIPSSGKHALLSDDGNRPSPALISLRSPKSTTAEAFRALRSSLLLSRPGGVPKVILITSSIPSEGKSLISTNLAIVLAQSGSRVLLVGADLRKPAIHRLFHMPPGKGLSAALAGDGDPSANIIVSDELPSLHLLAAGPQPPFPSEMLASGRMHDLLEEWRADYDYIVLDTPPVSMVTDAVVLSSFADVVLLVARMGNVTRGALRIARSLLERSQAPMGGVVLNSIDQGAMYYYYGSYKGYGAYGQYGEDKDSAKARRKSA